MARSRRGGATGPTGAVPPGSEGLPDDDALIGALLREVHEVRRDLEVDLTLAVGATEADRADLAIDLVEDSRERVAALQESLAADSMLSRFTHLAAQTAPPRRRHPVARALAPLAPLVAAAAAVATLLSGAPAGLTDPTFTPASRQQQLQSEFEVLDLVVGSRRDAQTVLQASRRLHAAVTPLVDVAEQDPVAGATARSVLLRQRDLLTTQQPAGGPTALAETDQLLRRLWRGGIALPPLPNLFGPDTVTTVLALAPRAPLPVTDLPVRRPRLDVPSLPVLPPTVPVPTTAASTVAATGGPSTSPSAGPRASAAGPAPAAATPASSPTRPPPPRSEDPTAPAGGPSSPPPSAPPTAPSVDLGKGVVQPPPSLSEDASAGHGDTGAPRSDLPVLTDPPTPPAA